ncbi:hypothetical protein GTA08_BOTSDO12633 [Botryosphaeria dothidea]|uniref:Uncharacterized protein n=1 Tax=Botryosphaeria dothidea TaxID=55169 RepID=A0A8H4J1X8_9PEZI|nr:hypothetical protein GTA08_BOTSDO12633 [Botryosphaeria dothidea]
MCNSAVQLSCHAHALCPALFLEHAVGTPLVATATAKSASASTGIYDTLSACSTMRSKRAMDASAAQGAAEPIRRTGVGDKSDGFRLGAIYDRADSR